MGKVCILLLLSVIPLFPMFFLSNMLMLTKLKAALLFWLFSDFRYGVPLFVVILVIYNNVKIGKNRF